MNKFFVPQKVYEDRIGICKGCVFYFKPTGTCTDCGCFMKIKARLAPMECSQKKWEKTKDVEVRTDIPEEIIEEIIALYPDLKTGRAKNQAAKKKMIELYNTISGSNYNTKTNCGSCISTCFDGIKKIHNEYSKD